MTSLKKILYSPAIVSIGFHIFLLVCVGFTLIPAVKFEPVKKDKVVVRTISTSISPASKKLKNNNNALARPQVIHENKQIKKQKMRRQARVVEKITPRKVLQQRLMSASLKSKSSRSRPKEPKPTLSHKPVFVKAGIYQKNFIKAANSKSNIRSLKTLRAKHAGRGTSSRIMQRGVRYASHGNPLPRRARKINSASQGEAIQTAKFDHDLIDANDDSGSSGSPQIKNDSGLASLKGLLAGIRSQIESSKRYPKFARRAGHEGEVWVKFTLLKSGEIDNLRIMSKCPYESLNKEALATVERVAPFHKLPDGIKKQFVEVELPFSFRLN